MSETLQWEYRVQSVGSAMSGLKDEVLEALLNSWSEEGWEVMQVVPLTGSNKVRVVARKQLTRADLRERSWPSS